MSSLRAAAPRRLIPPLSRRDFLASPPAEALALPLLVLRPDQGSQAEDLIYG